MPGRYADPDAHARRAACAPASTRSGAARATTPSSLGCGAPIGAVVGVVDGMRIGADVAPWWNAPARPGRAARRVRAGTPATRNAFVNTCTRSFMHRRLWSNDPDCVMLRTDDTQLDAAAAPQRGRRPWRCSGGLALVSDDLALLGAERAPRCSTRSSRAAGPPTPARRPGRRPAPTGCSIPTARTAWRAPAAGSASIARRAPPRSRAVRDLWPPDRGRPAVPPGRRSRKTEDRWPV